MGGIVSSPSAIVCSFNKRHIAALLLAYSLAVGNYAVGRAAPVRLALHHFLNERVACANSILRPVSFADSMFIQ